MNARMMVLMPVERRDDGACGPVAANDPAELFEAYRRAMRTEDLLAEVAAMAAMKAPPAARMAA